MLLKLLQLLGSRRQGRKIWRLRMLLWRMLLRHLLYLLLLPLLLWWLLRLGRWCLLLQR